jgi:hypothetical protein
MKTTGNLVLNIDIALTITKLNMLHYIDIDGLDYPLTRKVYWMIVSVELQEVVLIKFIWVMKYFPMYGRV